MKGPFGRLTDRLLALVGLDFDLYLSKRFFDGFGDLRATRAHVLPHIGFASQLQRFEHELFEGPAGERRDRFAAARAISPWPTFTLTPRAGRVGVRCSSFERELDASSDRETREHECRVLGLCARP